MVTLNKEGLIMTAKTPRPKIPAPQHENIQMEPVTEPVQVQQPVAITAYDKFWDDLPSYIVDPIINGDPNATLTSDLTVSNALKLKFECRGSYATEICLHVGKTAMSSGIYMEVESTHINDKSEYRVHAKFDCVQLNNAPNANSLYNYLMANISKVAR